MNLRIPNKDEHNEFGIHYAMPWELLIPGSSVFVPTLTPRRVGRWFKRRGEERGMVLSFTAGVENGIYGVRLVREK